MKGLAILLLFSIASAEPPYPASGWQPAGERLRLPIRNLKQQQEPVPHTVYGPPSTEAPTEPPVTEFAGYQYPAPSVPQQPGTEYGAPPQQPETELAEPEQPTSDYGPPPQQPNTDYGAPQEPQSGYGAPQQPANGYEAQQPDNGYNPEQPDNGYGAPQQPGYEYQAPEQPSNEYGAPPQPGSEYGAPQQPEEGSGQAPLAPGATERLRQNQFFQQLPHFESSRFIKNNRLRQPVNQPQRFQAQPQRFQNQPQRYQNKPQSFQSQPQRLQAQPQKNQNFRLTQQNFRQQPNMQNIRQVNQNLKAQSLKKYRTDYKTISDEDYKKFPARLRQSTNLEVETFDSQKLPKPLSTNTFQKQDVPSGLYTTPTPESSGTTSTNTITKRTRRPQPTESSANDDGNPLQPGPNIAVATAVAGQYYVLQLDGTVQRVTYKTENGQLVDGAIESNLKYSDIQPITAPIYSTDTRNQLVRIN